jgi:hypothetical protein
MITTRTYLKGCDWCNATGHKFPMQHNGTDFSSICPACNGNKVITVTETFESKDESLRDELIEFATENKEIFYSRPMEFVDSFLEYLKEKHQ